MSVDHTAGSVGRGLSGLARAFLFAGVKALLVSNWDVASDEAARLMARHLRPRPADRRAQALRRAMIKALDQAPTTERSHPLFWAPFVVVGDSDRRDKAGQDGENSRMRGVRAAVRGALAAFGLIAGAQSVVAQSEPPVGLVIALTGSTSPPVAAMAEIPAETPLRLAPDAQLTFLHYGRCKLVTVSGGTVTLSRTEFRTDGQIVADKDGPCPRIHSLGHAGTVTGGMVMRGGGELPRLPLDLKIVVAGAGSNGIKAAAIYAEDKFEAPLVQMQVSGHSLRLPTAGEGLAPNGRYVLRLMMADRATPVDIPFIGTAPDGPELVLLLR